MLEFAYGNREGRHFTEWRFDELRSLAEYLSALVKDATDWKLWYDAHHDYHHMSFRLGEDLYDIRYYKVFAITKNGDERNSKVLGRSANVEWFFHGGRHLTWADA